MDELQPYTKPQRAQRASRDFNLCLSLAEFWKVLFLFANFLDYNLKIAIVWVLCVAFAAFAQKIFHIGGAARRKIYGFCVLGAVSMVLKFPVVFVATYYEFIRNMQIVVKLKMLCN